MKKGLETKFADIIDLQILEGPPALDKFNAFLRDKYKWLWSGVDWRESEYIERVENVHHDLAKHIGELISRHKELFSDKQNVFFYDATRDCVVTAPTGELLKIMKFAEEWDDFYINEFWVFDEKTNTLIEAYHEGYITLAQSK